jgi:hypothetical protein
MTELELSVEIPTKNTVVFLRFTQATTRAEREHVETMVADVRRETGLTIVVLPVHLRPEAHDGGGLSALAKRVAQLEALLGAAQTSTPNVLP